MSAERRPSVTGLHAAVQIDAVLHEIVGQVDFLVGGEIQHQQQRRVGVGKRNVLAVAGHVVRRGIEEEGVGVDPRPAVPGLELRQRWRVRRIWRSERGQQVSLQRVGVIDRLAAVAVRGAEGVRGRRRRNNGEHRRRLPPGSRSCRKRASLPEPNESAPG